jgi:chemotaxis-related protein WspB
MLALTFQVGADRVAVDVRRVREVVPRVRVTPASGGPGWLAGMFVYRGRVVPVVDLHRLVGTGECPQHLSSRVILVPRPDSPDDLVGLLATQVADVRDLPAPHAPPPGGSLLGPPVADGAGILRLLDPDHLLAALGSELGPPRPGIGP